MSNNEDKKETVKNGWVVESFNDHDWSYNKFLYKHGKRVVEEFYQIRDYTYPELGSGKPLHYLFSRQVWNNGNLILWDYFFEEGNLESRTHYSNEIEIRESYYPNGVLKGRNTKENNQEEWFIEKFHQNGILKCFGTRKYTEKRGFWVHFDKDGNVTKTEEYKYGELVE